MELHWLLFLVLCDLSKKLSPSSQQTESKLNFVRLFFSRAPSSLHVSFLFGLSLPHGCCRDKFFFHSYSDAWRRRRRRRRSGKMDEGADVTSQLQDSADEGKEIPIHAKEVIEALQDLEDEYDLHPKHAGKN